MLRAAHTVRRAARPPTPRPPQTEPAVLEVAEPRSRAAHGNASLFSVEERNIVRVGDVLGICVVLGLLARTALTDSSRSAHPYRLAAHDSMLIQGGYRGTNGGLIDAGRGLTGCVC